VLMELCASLSLSLLPSSRNPPVLALLAALVINNTNMRKRTEYRFLMGMGLSEHVIEMAGLVLFRHVDMNLLYKWDHNSNLSINLSIYLSIFIYLYN